MYSFGYYAHIKIDIYIIAFNLHLIHIHMKVANFKKYIVKNLLLLYI